MDTAGPWKDCTRPMIVRPMAPSIPTGTTCDKSVFNNVISFLLLTAHAIFSFLYEPANSCCVQACPNLSTPAVRRRQIADPAAC